MEQVREIKRANVRSQRIRKFRRGIIPFSPRWQNQSIHQSLVLTYASYSLGPFHLLNLFDLLIALVFDNPTIPDQALSARTNPPFPTSQFLKLFDDLHPFDDLAENDVFPAIGQPHAGSLCSCHSLQPITLIG